MHRSTSLASHAIKRRSLSITSTREFATVLSPDPVHGGGFNDVFDIPNKQDGEPIPLVGFSPSRRFSSGPPRPAPQPMPTPVLYDGPSMGGPARQMSTAARLPTSLGPITTYDGPSRLRVVSTRGGVAPVSAPRTSPSQTLLPDWAKAELARLGAEGLLNPES